MSRSDKVLWKASSSRSDWRDGAPLRRVIDGAARLGLIGPPTRGVTGVKPGGELVQAILDAAEPEGGGCALTVGGDDPAPWELFWNVYPFDEESGWVDGMNNLFFTFDRSRVPGRKASDALAEAFFTASSGGDVEYAVIHPAEHWSRFADEHYDPPVTINIQFHGVFWANFLGPGHVEEFDLAKLRDLQEAHEVRWVDGGKGLLVIATPDLASAGAPESEPVLLRLNERFREALRPDSRWS